MTGVAMTDSANRYWCLVCRSYIASPYAHYCQGPAMPTEPTPVPAPQPSLRKAAAEAMLAGALLLSDAKRDSPNWGASAMATNSEERFRKALEQLAEELGK